MRHLIGDFSASLGQYEQDFYEYTSRINSSFENFFSRSRFSHTISGKDRTGPNDLCKDSTVDISYIHWAARAQLNDIKAVDQTQKPVFLLLPGIFSNARHLDFTSLNLSRQGFEVFVIDWPGHGESGNLPSFYDYNFKNQAAIVRNMLDTVLKGREVALYGSSFGAMIAYEMANQDIQYFNDRIKSFITIDQGPVNEGDSALRRPWRAHETRSFPDLSGFVKGMRTFCGTHGNPPPECYCAHITNQSVMRDPRTGDMVWKLDHNLLNGFHRELTATPMSYWNTAKQITAPWLFVWGEHSDTVNQGTLDRIQLAGNVSSLKIPNTGHVPGMWHPAQIDYVGQWQRDPSSKPNSFTLEDQSLREAMLLLPAEDRACYIQSGHDFFPAKLMKSAEEIAYDKKFGIV
jgi:pimeloyl-ACP methyl ester carboxylesterase